jgi:hypothetical protein
MMRPLRICFELKRPIRNMGGAAKTTYNAFNTVVEMIST